jgi:protoporphyrinogen oxidase
VRILPGFATRRVAPEEGGGIAVEAEDGRRDVFDRVVLTVAAPIAARLCPTLGDEERARLEGVQYLGVICASLLLKKPLAGFYVTNITDDGFPFTGVIEMSALVDRAQFGGHCLVYLPKYVDPDDPAFALPDEELQRQFLAGLARMYPGLDSGDLLCFKVSRVRRVFALSTIGYSKRLPAMATSLPGLHVVNSAHILNGTLNVNETLQLAERSAASLLASASDGAC